MLRRKHTSEHLHLIYQTLMSKTVGFRDIPTWIRIYQTQEKNFIQGCLNNSMEKEAGKIIFNQMFKQG